jgi:hypothetical protein
VPGNVAVYAFDEAVERHQIPHDQLRHARLSTTCTLRLDNRCNVGRKAAPGIGERLQAAYAKVVARKGK